MEILVLIGWVFLSFFVAALAGEKGQSGLMFLFLSLLLSPLIGLIAVAAAGTTPEEKQRRQVNLEEKQLKTGKMKRCPACAELVKAQATVCRHCGHEFVTPQMYPKTDVPMKPWPNP